MNELLQKHGCSNVFSVPEGLKELMSDITREVLREQPSKIYDFIANYLSAMLITREHGILAVKILDDLCDCRASVSEHLLQVGIEKNQADNIAEVIREEIESFEPVEGKEKLKETQMLKKIMKRNQLDEEMAAKVCQVARNAYRDYWYRKKVSQEKEKDRPEEPWERAAANTLEIYKRTKPSFSELNRAAERIQAAYRGYYVRKKILKHLKPRTLGPKMELPGPPLDIAVSREIDLGPLVEAKVKEDDVVTMFTKHTGIQLGLQYDPLKAITHIENELPEPRRPIGSALRSKKRPKTRAQSFALEVLGLESQTEGLNRSRTGTLYRPSQDTTVSREFSPASLNKKISFAGDRPIIIPNVDSLDDISEELEEKDYRSDGDGDSEPSLSSGPVTANISDAEDVEDATNDF